jgi:stage V sporulation protein G
MNAYKFSQHVCGLKIAVTIRSQIASRGGRRMVITEVKVFPVNEDRLKAYVSITIDNCFVIRDLKIIEGTGGLFVAMPSKKRKDGQFKDIAHPLNQETRDAIEKAVFNAYEAEVRAMGTSLDALKTKRAGDF